MYQESNVLTFTPPAKPEITEEERLNLLAKIALANWVHHSMPWHFNPFKPFAVFNAAGGYAAQRLWQIKEARPYFWASTAPLRAMRRHNAIAA